MLERTHYLCEDVAPDKPAKCRVSLAAKIQTAKLSAIAELDSTQNTVSAQVNVRGRSTLWNIVDVDDRLSRCMEVAIAKMATKLEPGVEAGPSWLTPGMTSDALHQTMCRGHFQPYVQHRDENREEGARTFSSSS